MAMQRQPMPGNGGRQAPRPQQEPVRFGQQVTVLENGEPVGQGTVVNVTQGQGGPQIEVAVPRLQTTVTIGPDSRHQVAPAQGQERQPGQAPSTGSEPALSQPKGQAQAPQGQRRPMPRQGGM